VIVVDSSIWIDLLNGRHAPHVRRLQAALGTDEIIVGDLMLCEVLQGLENERAAREVDGLNPGRIEEWRPSCRPSIA
jgi:predicted nucleic acid-binding protein